MREDIKKIIESLNIKFAENFDEGHLITCSNYFYDNKGYHLIEFNGNKIILLKGIYKDFVRVLKGEKFLKESHLSKISEMLSDIEKNINQPFTCKIVNETWEIVDLNLVSDIGEKDPKAALKINRPLSQVEYSLFRQDIADYKNLYFCSLFKEVFPHTLSPLASSILTNIPEVMSVIFAHANFKVYSPSLKLLWGKVYGSMSTYLMAFESMNTNDTFLKLNYAQFRYIKEKNKKLKIPKISSLELTTNEINGFIEEIGQKTENIDEKYIFEQEFLELLSLGFMSAQMIFLMFSELFSKIYDITGNIENTLRLIYKTRKQSPFFSDKTFEIPLSFDLCPNFITLSPTSIKSPMQLSDAMKIYSGLKFFKKSKLESLIKNIHQILLLRDNLSNTLVALLKKIHIVFEKLADNLLRDSKIKFKDNIYFLEYNDIKGLVSDSYYGNTQFTYFFKKWQNERFKMQIIPYEIFEKDIQETENIAKNIISKLLSQNEYDILSFFHKEDLKADFEEVSIYNDLSILNSMKPIISDNISLLSYAIEFATINEIPVYSGLRFPEIILSDKTFILTKNKLKLL
jgi:hypothetical protein